MSGPFGSSQWMYASGGFYPYQIEQSLRFNDDDSAYLSRTPASAGNRKTWTWSGWVKQGVWQTDTDPIFTSRSGLNFTQIVFDDNQNLYINQWNGSPSWIVQSNAVFRDASAWYHIVASVDSTQATSTNRVKLYVNGEQITSFSSASYPSLNQDSFINSTTTHFIGSYGGSEIFDGYMAEVNFIDGTALDPTSFGETKSGIWVPKAYSGSYGTNGFYLSFADSAAIGDDLSGNGNDWTANNLVSTDVLLDSPTNNWCVLNPLASTGNTLSEGNLKEVSNSSGITLGSFAVSSGKWYWEVVPTNTSNSIGFAVSTIPSSTAYTGLGSSWSYYQVNGQLYTNGSGTSYGDSYAAGDIIGVALDLDAGTATFYKNNVSQGVAVTGLTGEYVPAVGNDQSGPTLVCNFGQDSSFAGNETAQGNTDDNGQGDFYYAPPSGFLALNTANLPDPAIDPAQDDVPADYFNTVLYTGTGATQSITGVGFQPDWTWIKTRSNTASHSIFDAVRGANNWLASDSTDAATSAQTDLLTSFDADGFSLGANTGSKNTNKSGQTYVGWNWLAGNGTSSNTDGSITSTVSVNQKAGFSVVSYTGTQTTDTVGHGLGAAPKFIISKSRTNSNGWPTLHAPSGNYGLRLNSTGANDSANGNLFFQNTAPTSSVFYVGSNDENNTSGGSMIAYCFAEVEGYSKFGSYTGNGSTDGPFVYCGFRPAFVMVKQTDSTSNWTILDAARGPYNVNGQFLAANLSNSETYESTRQVDFLSNGFKPRPTSILNNDINSSGGTYIFMAFAEAPFKYSNAR